MEIEAVAECNREAPYSRKKKVKIPMFPETHFFEEPSTDSGTAKNSPSMKTVPITESLLALSDSSDLDYIRHKIKKRISGDQFGPWLFPDKWSPRKRPGPHRGGKRVSNPNSSPTRFPSPDDKHSPRCRYPKTPTTSCYADVRFHRGGDGYEQGKADDEVTDDKVIDQRTMKRKELHHKIRPATVPDQPSVNRNTVASDMNRLPGHSDTKPIPVYPKHSLPTLITLRPADSSNSYDTVFSLGKSDLTSKDIIVSMGQNNKLSSHYTRQTRSAVASSVPDLQIDDVQSKFHAPDGVQRGPDANAVIAYRGRSKVMDARNRGKPSAPMCEHQDTRQHMLYYRVHHTVRFTGRFSLANEQPVKKDIQSVQWNDVFPDRPLSTTTRSTSKVPVFRFSVSDFRQEQIVRGTDVHRQTRADRATRGTDGNSRARDWLAKPSIVAIRTVSPDTHQQDQSARKTPSNSDVEAPLGTAWKRDVQERRDAIVSLSPTVRPVTTKTRSSWSPDCIDSWRAGSCVGRKLKSARSESDSSGHHSDGCVCGKDEKAKNDEGNDDEDGIDDDNDEGNEDQLNKYDDNEKRTNRYYKNYSVPIGCSSSTTGASPNLGRKEESTRFPTSDVKFKGDNPTTGMSRLAKTRAYIQSSYRVYNDTIQNVASSGQGSCYKEFLLRKRRQGKSCLSWNNENADDGDGIEDIPRPSDGDVQAMKARFKSPHRFSHILKDIMGYPRSKMFCHNLETKGARDTKTGASDDDEGRCESNVPCDVPRGNNSMGSKTSVTKPRPTLSIDTQQLRDSVERKLYEGNKLLSRSLMVGREVENTDNDRFVRFLVKEEREQKMRSLGMRRKPNSPRVRQAFGMISDNELSHGHLRRVSDNPSERTLGTASVYDLNAESGTSPRDKDENLNFNDNHHYWNASSSVSTSPECQQTPSTSVTNGGKIWRPGASRWNRKPPPRNENRPTSSAFHYRPTSSSASAYVIAAPPLQMGFEDRGVVLPLDDFVRMAMKGRESSFSAWSQSVNAGSKVGIAPNGNGRSAGSVRKPADDGLVRVVSFATPVNQFIFAKRLTGYPVATTINSAATSSLAEEVGRRVFQRKTAGTFRLSLNDADNSKAKIDDSETRISAKDSTHDDDGRDSTELPFPPGLAADVKENETSATMFKEQSKFKEENNNQISTRIEVDMNPLLRGIEDNAKLVGNIDMTTHNGRWKANSPMVEKRNDLRNKVVRLAEMKTLNDPVTRKDSHSQPRDHFTDQDVALQETASTEDENPADETDTTLTNRHSGDSLAQKFSQLRRKRLKALKRGSIIKQTSVVRKSIAPEITMETETSTVHGLSLSLSLNASQDLTATDTAIVGISKASQPGQPRPKTVRFACDEMDANDSYKHT